MTRQQDPRLATLDELIARQEQVLAALVAARALMAGEDTPPARKADVKLLPAPKAKGRSGKAKPAAANDDVIEHELDDVTLTVTPLQSAILDCLGAAFLDAVPGPVLAKSVGKSLPTVRKAIYDLCVMLKDAGSKCEVNSYRGRGFVLEMERD